MQTAGRVLGRSFWAETGTSLRVAPMAAKRDKDEAAAAAMALVAGCLR